MGVLNQKEFNSLVADGTSPDAQHISDFKGQMIAGYYSTTAPSLSDGQSVLLRTTAEGKLMVDTELSVSTASFTIDNIKVFSTDGAVANVKYAKVDSSNRAMVDINEQTLTALKVSSTSSANLVTNPLFAKLTDGTTGVGVTSSGKLMVDAEVTLVDYTDKSTEFTLASSKGLALMGVATSGTVTSGDIAAIRITTDRNLGVDTTSNVPTSLLGGEKTNSGTGAPEALGASLVTKSIYIRAKSANTSFVCVGDSLVHSGTSQQIKLDSNDSVTLDISNRATVYVAVNVANEGVDYLTMS